MRSFLGLVFFGMLFIPKLRCAALAATNKRIAVIGGGASGIFSAVSAAEHYAQLSRTDGKGTRLEVVVLEATSKILAKVAISGGGRCNGTGAILVPV